MGLEKAGLKFINAWTKTSERSLLATSPVKVNISELRLAPTIKSDVLQITSPNKLSKYVRNFKQSVNKETNEVIGSYTYKDKMGVEHLCEYNIYDYIGKKSDRRLVLNIDGEYAGYADIGVKNCDNFSHPLCCGYPDDANIIEAIWNGDISRNTRRMMYRENGYFSNGGIYIDYMESYKSGAGTQLHKIIAQRSLDLGYNGRVGLDADFNAHCFHYKCGFRPYDGEELGHINTEEANRLTTLLKEAEKTGIRAESPNEIKGGHYAMMLPIENLEKLFSM